MPHVDLDHLRDIMKLMDQFDFDELEVRDEGKRLHISRGGRTGGQGPAVVMPAMMPAAAPTAGAAGEPATAAGDQVPADVTVVTSPMVGTFYRAPSPDAAPFVEEGQEIQEGTVLCIIEAMKVMNEIKAECSGTIVKILVANGEAVEYGEPLFHIRTS
ncbi:MAG: acetyl-CoA carboxylase biotin carboxyl carrier protein [Planctomycetota bacterium]|nr:MAG: acetyl-CoA carboxylase biotin carboxyl carrier protein [Planctomycetota bacterium]